MAEPTSLLLGLKGLEVTSVARGAGRVRVVDVVTADRWAARCPECKVASSAVKGRAITRVTSATEMTQAKYIGLRPGSSL